MNIDVGRDFKKVGKTAYPHVFYRTFYGIQYADEMAQTMNA